MKLLIVFLCGALVAHGADIWYVGSLVGAGSSHVLDIRSSWGKHELNPVLGGGRFDVRQTAIKTSIVSSTLAVSAIKSRNNKKARKVLTIVNFCVAGITTGIAIRNYRVKK